VSAKHRIPAVAPRAGESIPSVGPAKSESVINQKVVLSFEVFDHGVECPSTWGTEIRELFSTFRKLTCQTWMQVFRSGGSENKSGLGFTPFKIPPFTPPSQISKDLTISEIRVTRKARIFGAQKGGIYYVIRLDRNHTVCPE
jgi:hypothetical protein